RPQPHTALVYLTSQPEVPFDPIGRQSEPTRSCIYDLNFQLKYHPNRVINESIVQVSNIILNIIIYIFFLLKNVVLFKNYFIYNLIKDGK
ncbi:hypothetical protein ALC60_14792, partial [Trachymyrmex zeteki]